MRLSDLAGIGSQLQKRLEQAGIRSPLDILFWLPRGYQDRTRLHTLNQLRPNCQLLIEAEVIRTEIITTKRQMMLCHVSDGKGYIILRFFHFHPAQAHQLQPGLRLRCFGEVRQGLHFFEMVHPEYKIIHQHESLPVDDRLTPLYPAIEGISQTKFRSLVQQVLYQSQAADQLELLPEPIRLKEQLSSLFEALVTVHMPTPDTNQAALLEGTHPAQQRLALEELVAHRIALRERRKAQEAIPAHPLPLAHRVEQSFRKLLPFQLTAAQERVIQEIAQDLTQPKAMMRLIQGDVGSGKTIVALMAILQAVSTGKQAAIMAPTEILAEQHFQNFLPFLTSLNLSATWLTSRLSAKERRQALEAIASGQALVVAGTHALFQEEVKFKDLALIVIDEQHRFGVS